MFKNLSLFMLLSTTLCVQAMDTVSVLDLDQKNIDATCAQLVSLDTRRKYLKPLAIAAIVAGVGYGAKKIFFDASDEAAARLAKTFQDSNIGQMTPAAQQALTLALVAEREELLRVQNEEIANRTFVQGAKKGAQEYWKWFKTNVPWAIGTGLTYAAVSQAQNIVTDVLPLDTITDTFMSSKSLKWYSSNRTQCALAQATLLDNITTLAPQLLAEERGNINNFIAMLDAKFQMGEELTDQEIEQYNKLAARAEELDAMLQLTPEQMDDVAQKLPITGALLIKELEKVVGYVQYHGTLLEAKLASDSKNAIFVAHVKGNALVEKKLRDLALELKKIILAISEKKHATRTDILAVKDVFKGIQKEIGSYELLEK